MKSKERSNLAAVRPFNPQGPHNRRCAMKRGGIVVSGVRGRAEMLSVRDAAMERKPTITSVAPERSCSQLNPVQV